MSANFLLPLSGFLLLTLPAGYWLLRRVFRAKPVNLAFDLSTAFFLGLFLDVVVLNALQWLPFPVSARNGFLVLSGLHLSAFLALIWTGVKTHPRLSQAHNTMGQGGSFKGNNPSSNFAPEKAREIHGKRGVRAGSHLLMNRWPELVVAALALAVLLYGLHLSSHLPVLAWDAWSGWVAKAKIWAHEGLNAPIVPPSLWLEKSPSAGIFSSHMWHYPDAVGLLYATFSIISGTVEQGAAVLWSMVSGFLALGIYGFLLHQHTGSLTSGKQAGLAALAAFLLLITPLWMQHTIFAGYADILFAAFLWMATAHYVLWLHSHLPAYRWLSLVFLLALPLIKLFGWFAIAIFLASASFFQPAWRRRLLSAVIFCAIALIFAWLMMPFALDTPVGTIVFDRQHLQLPGYGTVQLRPHWVLWPWLEGMLFSRNWLLMWFAFPFVAWLGFRQKPAIRGLSLFVALTVVYLGVVLCLFSLTSFSQYAQTFTSSNRVLLHVYPVYLTAMFWIIMTQAKSPACASQK